MTKFNVLAEVAQLMALGLGLSPDVCLFDLHTVDPRPLLKTKNLI